MAKARLSARYGTLEKSPERPLLTLRQMLVLGGLLAIGVTGGVVWMTGMTVEKEGAVYRIVRKQHAPARTAEQEEPAEPATTRADGRLVG